MDTLTKSPKQTANLGKKIGVDLVDAKSGSHAKVVALTGNLGSGKTTFVQGFAKGVGIEAQIISPTFILARSYKIANSGVFYHIDLYRLEGDVEKELVNIGFDEIIDDPNNIVVIEWANKATGAMPKDTLWIDFKNLEGDERKISYGITN